MTKKRRQRKTRTSRWKETLHDIRLAPELSFFKSILQYRFVKLLSRNLTPS